MKQYIFHLILRPGKGLHVSTSTALCWCAGNRYKALTYQVMLGGGELNTLQCIITPLPSTTEYSSASLVRIIGGRSAKSKQENLIIVLRVSKGRGCSDSTFQAFVVIKKTHTHTRKQHVRCKLHFSSKKARRQEDVDSDWETKQHPCRSALIVAVFVSRNYSAVRLSETRR